MIMYFYIIYRKNFYCLFSIVESIYSKNIAVNLFNKCQKTSNQLRYLHNNSYFSELEKYLTNSIWGVL